MSKHLFALNQERKSIDIVCLNQAVREEWIQEGHRLRAVRMLLLYLVYLAIFTLSSVLNCGRNMPHGYHLTMYGRDD